MIGLMVSLVAASTWASDWEVYGEQSVDKYTTTNSKNTNLTVVAQASRKGVLVINNDASSVSNAVMVGLGTKTFSTNYVTTAVSYDDAISTLVKTNRSAIQTNTVESGRSIVSMKIADAEGYTDVLLGTEVWSEATTKKGTNTTVKSVRAVTLDGSGVAVDTVDQYSKTTLRYNQTLSDSMNATTNQAGAQNILNTYVKKQIGTTNAVSITLPEDAL